jgi:hypothetical protein
MRMIIGITEELKKHKILFFLYKICGGEVYGENRVGDNNE